MKHTLSFLLLCCGILFITNTRAQKFQPGSGHETPGGHFDVVFDRFGHQYTLNQLAVDDVTRLHTESRLAGAASAPPSSASTRAYTGCTPGYFRIYLEAGCGMDLYATDATQAARLNVLCQVLTDIANFVPSPCTTTGQTVNIWIRGGLTDGLGVATPFFNIPRSFTASGIADNTVWETLNSGVDAFKNIAPPTATSGGGTTGITTGASIYFHGSIALNFGGSVSWHTDLTTPPAIGEADMYTVALHEMMHVMGFCSLIDYNGRSVFDIYNVPPMPAAYQYYSRYDLNLQTASSVPLITGTASGCDLYQYSFNPAAASVPNTILSPGGTSAPGCATGVYALTGETDTTVCIDALQYLGGFGTPIPVYTPACFEKGGSLNHFDDQCYVPSGFCPACVTDNGEYFVMSNESPSPALGGYSATLNPGVMKRYLTPEERQVLCDIGYKVLTTFGNAANLNAQSYGGSVCPGTQVVGFNDGITNTGTYAFSTVSGGSVQISGPSLGTTILDNDRSAGTALSTISGATFKCLEVVTGTGTVSASSGGVGTNVTYTAGGTDFGVELLRYIPVNSLGTEGNITYVYVFVGDVNCVPTACNLVTNGGFESLMVPGSSGFNLVGENCWTPVNGVSFLLATDASTSVYGTEFLIPNYYYFINGVVHPLSPPSNDHYVLFYDGYVSATTWFSTGIQEQLSVPLDSGQQYTISFWGLLGVPTADSPLTNPAYASLVGRTVHDLYMDTALASPFDNIASHLQFAVGSTYPLIGTTDVPTNFMPAGFTALAEFNVVPDSFLWHYYTLTVTYNGPPGASTLFIQGSIWDDSDAAGPLSNIRAIGVDDISIVPASSVCASSLPDTVYATVPPFPLSSVAGVCGPGGTFSWPTLPVIAGHGVPEPTITTSGTFDPISAFTASIGSGGSGLIPVAYTYTTPAGCMQTVYANIQVIDTLPLTSLQVNAATVQPFHIYPNPANDILYVDYSANGQVMPNGDETTYRLQNAVGQVMQQGVLNAGHNSIPMQSLPAGIYMLAITGADGQKTVTKIVKQ